MCPLMLHPSEERLASISTTHFRAECGKKPISKSPKPRVGKSFVTDTNIKYFRLETKSQDIL